MEKVEKEAEKRITMIKYTIMHLQQIFLTKKIKMKKKRKRKQRKNFLMITIIVMININTFQTKKFPRRTFLKKMKNIQNGRIEEKMILLIVKWLSRVMSLTY